MRSTLLELPTGTGKTVCFAELARVEIMLGGRVLMLAHREELLDQASKKFEAVGVWSAIEQGSQRAGGAPCVIASVATMHKRRRATFSPNAFTLIIVDEGHHAAATSYRENLDYFATARVLLVTATPDRADGKALKAVCDSVAYRYEMRQAIRDGWLVPLRAKRVLVDGIDLSRVSVHHGDFDQGQLAEVFGDERALHGVAIPLLKLSGNRRTIAFAVDVAHAHALAAMLNRYEPGSARAVDGTAKRDERKEILAAFRRGDFRVLVNCALYTEGFDEPTVSCVAIARPTQSRALHCQMLGRGTRILEGKTDCIILDFVGNAGKHSLIGPADALESNDIDAELRAQIEELLLGENDRGVEDVIQLAIDELANKRRDAKFLAVADYRTREVDPFLEPFYRTPNAKPLDGPPASRAQIARLKDDGLDKLPAALTVAEASRWIGALDARTRKGLPSLKLTRSLERANFDTTNMTNDRAKQLFKQLMAAEFKHPLLSHEPEYRPGWKRKADR